MTFNFLNNNQYNKMLNTFVNGSHVYWKNCIDKNKVVKAIDKKIQNLFQKCINTARNTSGEDHHWCVNVEKNVILHSEARELLQKVAPFFNINLIIQHQQKEYCKEKDKYEHLLYYPHIFEGKHLCKYNIDVKWTPDNRFIYDPSIHRNFSKSLGLFYDKSNHFKKEWEALQNTEANFPRGIINYNKPDGTTITASRYKLSIYSDVFKRWFMEQPSPNKILDVGDLRTFKAVIKFIHMGELNDSDMKKIGPVALFHAADKFKVKGLQLFCLDYFNNYFQKDKLDSRDITVFDEMMSMGFRLSEPTQLFKVCLAHAEEREELLEVFINHISGELLTDHRYFMLLVDLCKEMGCKKSLTQLAMISQCKFGRRFYPEMKKYIA